MIIEYIEYQSFWSVVRIGSLCPLPRKRMCLPPRTQKGGATLDCRWGGGGTQLEWLNWHSVYCGFSLLDIKMPHSVHVICLQEEKNPAFSERHIKGSLTQGFRVQVYFMNQFPRAPEYPITIFTTLRLSASLLLISCLSVSMTLMAGVVATGDNLLLVIKLCLGF